MALRLWGGAGMLALAVIMVMAGDGIGQPPMQCEFDCHDTTAMAGFSGGDSYCWEFDAPQGRLVWAQVPGVGGTPGTPLPNCTRTGDAYDGCTLHCTLQQMPQIPDIGGDDIGDISQGCYECSG